MNTGALHHKISTIQKCIYWCVQVVGLLVIVWHNAYVAVIRLRNERAMKNTKNCWIVQRGVRHLNFDLATLDDIWLAWGFQVNFMYETVLQNNYFISLLHCYFSSRSYQSCCIIADIVNSHGTDSRYFCYTCCLLLAFILLSL